MEGDSEEDDAVLSESDSLEDEPVSKDTEFHDVTPADLEFSSEKKNDGGESACITC